MSVFSISGSLRRTVFVSVPLAFGAVLAIWYLVMRQPPIPQRILRIGFEVVPPVQIRTANGVGGLAVETVNEAAKRAGISLQWVETGTSSDEAFQRGLVDLWPIMVDLPERRRRVHISRPWLHSSHTLVMRAGSTVPGPGVASSIAVFKMPIHVRLATREFPSAQIVQLPDIASVVREVCKGTVSAGFLEDRAAMTALRERPPECAAMALRSETLPHLRLPLGVGSTFESAGAADKIRTEIGNLYRDGTLAVTIAKYSYYGLEDTWATYDLMEAAERSRWLAWGIGALVVALGVTVWQAASLRQRKRSEAAVRESEARFRAIFHQAAVGVVQVSLEGSVTMLNERCCEVLGYPREELLGSKWLDRINPDDYAAGVALLKQPLEGDSPHLSMEIKCVRKDGDLAWVRFYRSLVDEGGSRAKYFVAVVEDITQRKQAEAALEESEKRFRSMADTAPVLIWVAGPDSHCTFFNQEYLTFTGLTMEKALGNGWSRRIHPEDLERCQTNYATAFAERRGFQTECRLQRADGDYRWMLATGVPRFESSGAFAGYVGTCTDTTDVKRAQEEALARQNLEGLGVMARGIAHDFNNLLGSILATSELILSEIPPHSVAHGQVESIKTVAERAAEIVGQMLAYAGREDTMFEPLNLAALITEMLELMKVSISKRARLAVDLPEDLPPVLANAAQIRQVVMNLIMNASEALEEREGTIFVSVEHLPAEPDPPAADTPETQPIGRLRLIVRDTGCGMTEEVLTRIFDPFFTTKFTGRGLGLAAAQGIVRDHDGTILVVSAPGQGSRFEVLLRCTDQPVRRASATVTTSSGKAQKDEGNVLVIEDEDELRVAVSKMLRKQGFSVIEANDGLAGVELFGANPAAVDIVLLDLTLPRMSGKEVLDQLRRMRHDINVIITTAYSRDTVVQAVGEQQPWLYIRKPYRIGELTDLLRNVFGQDKSGVVRDH